MLLQLREAGLQHPSVREKHVVLLPRIVNQIKDPWHGVASQDGVPGILLLEVNLPISPLHAEDIVAHVDDESFASGLLGLPEEEVAHIDPVNRTIIRHLAVSDFGEGR